MAKFKKVIPSASVVRYFQIKNHLQILREAKAANQILLAIPTSTKTATK